MMVPVCSERVMVAGETTSLLSLSKMTARLETRTVSGMLESLGGVCRNGKLSFRFMLRYLSSELERRKFVGSLRVLEGGL